jgi:hypothetical protein
MQNVFLKQAVQVFLRGYALNPKDAILYADEVIATQR